MTECGIPSLVWPALAILPTAMLLVGLYLGRRGSTETEGT